jgi:hypothetical protein
MESMIEKAPVAESVESADLSVWDALISEDIDFRVEKRGLHTYGEDGGLNMPDHSATIRVNPDGSENPLWVVGSKYEVVDHREVIKQFAEVIDRSDMQADIKHYVYQNGCRIYSEFIIDQTFEVNGKMARPFFTLTTSHDGSLRIGFLMGAKVDGKAFNISKTVYGAHAKHTKGINVHKTMEAVLDAIKAFTEEVIPMWTRMQDTKLSRDEAQKVIENAVKKNVVAKRRADDIFMTSSNPSLWDVYTSVIDQVSVVRGKRGTEERAFKRNVDVSEHFNRLAFDTDMSTLKKIVGVKK